MLLVPIRVVSKNIRYATKAPFRGEEPWDIRKPHLINELRFHTIHNAEALICCQEALHAQLEDILNGLNSNGREWNYIGRGRDDGLQAGEYSPILYRPSIWELVFQDMIWFSPTPRTPSKDQGAGSKRVLTIGEFRHVHSGKIMRVYNTHLDDQSSDCRKRAAETLTNFAKESSKVPAILTGDFNSESSQEAYVEITSRGPFLDTFHQLTKLNRYGHVNTYTGFGFEGEPAKRIDYIFTSFQWPNPGKTPWKVVSYGVSANRFDTGIYNSDHRAVIADLMLQ